MSQPRFSLVIPLYNEAGVLQELAARVEKFLATQSFEFEVVLVDDGSSDETTLMMRSLALNNPVYHCVFLSRNFGHQAALSAGLKFARATDAVMILDGDLQDPPELFGEFHSFLLKGFDVVYGIRKKRKENIFKRILYHVFYRILNRISTTPIYLDSGDFSMISRRAVDIINGMPEDSRFLRGMRSWIGFKQQGVEYERDKRAGGVPKYTMTKLLRLGYDGIFNFSSFPIRFLTMSGLVCFLTALGYFFVTLIRKFLWGDVPVGFTSLLFMIIFFGGIQLFSIGIVGEYVFRIFAQVKKRPLYIVKEEIKEGKIADE